MHYLNILTPGLFILACAALPGLPLAKNITGLEITKTVTASHTTTKPAPCPLNLFPTFGAMSSATCTDYAETITKTITKDCSGCMVKTKLAWGHGPVCFAVMNVFGNASS